MNCCSEEGYSLKLCDLQGSLGGRDLMTEQRSLPESLVDVWAERKRTLLDWFWLVYKISGFRSSHMIQRNELLKGRPLRWNITKWAEQYIQLSDCWIHCILALRAYSEVAMKALTCLSSQVHWHILQYSGVYVVLHSANPAFTLESNRLPYLMTCNSTPSELIAVSLIVNFMHSCILSTINNTRICCKLQKPC